MKNQLLGVSVLLSLVSLGVSGFTLFRFKTVEIQLVSKIAEISQAQREQAAVASSTNANDNAISIGVKDESPVATTPSVSGGIEPGQFSNPGFDNQVTFELIEVRRLEAQPGKPRDKVNVRFRMRRFVEEVKKTEFVGFSRSRGRNPQTNEVYRTVRGQATSQISNAGLPYNAWAEAYFWLEIPEGIEVVDLVIPETQIFENVPISS